MKTYMVTFHWPRFGVFGYIEAENEEQAEILAKNEIHYGFGFRVNDPMAVEVEVFNK